MRRAIIPAAGLGSRFIEAGYTVPKPFIDVRGKPMLDRVIETLPDGIDEYIVVVRQEHMGYMKRLHLDPRKLTVLPIKDVTDGAARTVLLAASMIQPDDQVIVANSDQYITMNKKNFDTLAAITDGIIVTFNHSHPRWSFVELNKYGRVQKVVEKTPVSNIATAGIYFFAQARNLVRSIEKMIEKDIRTNGEFYFAPCYNEFIGVGGQIFPFYCEKMSGLGTPADLEAFLNTGKVNQ